MCERLRQGVIRGALQRRCDCQRPFGRTAGSDSLNTGTGRGVSQRAGFIQHHSINTRQPLNGVRLDNQQTQAGETGCDRREGRGRRQGQRTGAGHHEHRQCCGHCIRGVDHCPVEGY